MGENSSFIFTCYVKTIPVYDFETVPDYDFKLVWVGSIDPSVKEFTKRLVLLVTRAK